MTGDETGLKGIVFDLDGTLADTLPLCFAAFGEAFAVFAQKSYTPSEIAGMFGPSEEGIIRKIVPDRWQECLEMYLQFYEREHASIARPIDGVESLLEWLKANNIKIGIVTGKGPASAAITIEQLGVGRFVEAMEAGLPSGADKPSGIRKVLLEWNCSPNMVAYVGDAPSDMIAAAAVGTTPLGAAWAEGAGEDGLRAAGAEDVFRSPEALRQWLSSRGIGS